MEVCIPPKKNTFNTYNVVFLYYVFFKCVECCIVLIKFNILSCTGAVLPTTSSVILLQ